MRHHPHHIPPFVADARDRVHRSVRIPRIVLSPARIGVPKHDLAVRFELCDRLRRREVVPFTVADRNPQHLAGTCRAREGRIGLLDTQVNVLAFGFPPRIPTIIRKSVSFQQKAICR